MTTPQTVARPQSPPHVRTAYAVRVRATWRAIQLPEEGMPRERRVLLQRLRRLACAPIADALFQLMLQAMSLRCEGREFSPFVLRSAEALEEFMAQGVDGVMPPRMSAAPAPV